MPREWRPKKIGKLKYNKKSQKTLDEWFVKYASPTILEKKLKLSRASIYRYKKEIQEKEATLQDLVTVTMYAELIKLETADYEAYLKGMSKLVEEKEEKKRQIAEIDEELKSKGFGNLDLPKTIAATQKKDVKKEKNFAQLLLLEQSGDAKKISNARSEIRKLSREDRKKYYQYKGEHKDE